VLLLSLLAATAGRAAPALLIADGAGGLEDEACRAALRAAGVEVLLPAQTVTVVEAAAASGVSCAAGDVACWQAVATLAGYDDVVLVTGPEVVVAGRDGVRRSARLVAGVEGIAPAVARLYKQAGALLIDVQPAGVVRVDERIIAGGVADGLAVGPHVVSASAEGFVERQETVTIVAGEVARATWTLEAAPSVEGDGLSPALLYGGLGAIGLGVATGATISTVSFFSNGCTLVPFECLEENKPTAQAWDVTAIAVGAAMGLVGVGAIVASTVVE